MKEQQQKPTVHLTVDTTPYYILGVLTGVAVTLLAQGIARLIGG